MPAGARFRFAWIEGRGIAELQWYEDWSPDGAALFAVLLAALLLLKRNQGGGGVGCLFAPVV